MYWPCSPHLGPHICFVSVCNVPLISRKKYLNDLKYSRALVWLKTGVYSCTKLVSFSSYLWVCAVMHQVCFDLYGPLLFQVTHLSFYDVLLDYVLLDAFDDLETPPYSVATAVQNRWLSARIKETVSIRDIFKFLQE